MVKSRTERSRLPDSWTPGLLGLRPLERVLPVTKLATGGFAVELPVDLESRAIDAKRPGARLAAKRPQVGDSSAPQTLPREQTDFDFGLIEPASMDGRVVHRESIPDLGTHLGAKSIGQRLAGMDVEVIHHQVDGLGFRVLYRHVAGSSGDLQ